MFSVDNTICLAFERERRKLFALKIDVKLSFQLFPHKYLFYIYRF